MPGRYGGWIHTRGVTPGNKHLVNQEGRKLLTYVFETIERMGIQSWKATKHLPDGTYITASVTGAIPIVEIFSPAPADVIAIEVQSLLWIPRGFVVFPSSLVSAGGWGAPVLLDGDRFTAANTAPGLDVARWTPAGPLGEVFITQQIGAGYPKLQREIVPAFFSVGESPSGIVSGNALVGLSATFTPAATGETWDAFRMEFNDFTVSGGEGGAARQQLFNALNAGHGYLQPIRGYYDPAARAVRYVQAADFGVNTWLSDAMLPAAPTGYGTASQRWNKDGIADAIAHEAISKATTLSDITTDLLAHAHLADSTFTTEARVTLELGARTGAAAVVATERKQWIACGVRFWIGDDPAIPAISWDGYPCINWPSWIFWGSVDSGAWVDLDWFVMNVRDFDRPIFSKRICVNGRELGTLPDFVISAGVQTRTESGVTIDRLLVLAWRLSDQVLSAPSFGPPSDYMRRMRLYFIDAPRRKGLALAPDHAVIGLFDATTNPNGWHYAGLIDMVPTGELPFPLNGDANVPTQPPLFKGDGTAVVYCVETLESTTVLPLYLAETTLSDIGDAAVTTSYTDDLSARLEDPIPIGVGIETYLAADYVPASNKIRAVFVFQALVGDADISTARWSHSANSSDFVFHDSDIVVYEGSFHGFEFAGIFVQDVTSGTFTTLNQSDSLTTLRVDYATHGRPAVQTPYVATRSSIVTSIFQFDNRTDFLMPAFALDRAGEYIAGYEFGVLLALPGAAGFDSSIGDLQALTATPGTGMRLFPIGVV